MYPTVEDVDLTVGLYAETPPAGFGFSDTTFRIFILMASRRLKSDRFFTTDFTPQVYTPEGMAWIDGQRHVPRSSCATTPARAGAARRAERLRAVAVPGQEAQQ